MLVAESTTTLANAAIRKGRTTYPSRPIRARAQIFHRSRTRISDVPGMTSSERTCGGQTKSWLMWLALTILLELSIAACQACDLSAEFPTTFDVANVLPTPCVSAA